MPLLQARDYGSQKQAALLDILQRRIYERVMFASMMQAAVVQMMGLRVSEPTAHITPLRFI